MLKRKNQEVNLIDNRWFLFKCVAIKKGNEWIFTYKTDKNNYKLFNEYLNLLKRMNESKNFVQEFQQKRHNHAVDSEERQIIVSIYQELKYPEEWINQMIIDAPIFQTQLGDQGSRMFYSRNSSSSCLNDSNEQEIYIIKPILLDVNHLINKSKDRSFDKNYNTCLVCGKPNCD